MPFPDFLRDITVLHEALPELLDGLSDEEGFILGYGFGLGYGRPRNLGEIANILAACGKLPAKPMYMLSKARRSRNCAGSKSRP